MNIPLHEASHACMAHLLGFELVEVTATDKGGECKDSGPAPLFARGLDHRAVGLREALVALAPIAVNEELSSGDEACFARALWLACLPQREGLVRRDLIALAREILRTRENRTAIAAVADQLSRRKYLTGREVAELIEATHRCGFIL
ncbi:hypothetical protein AUC71_02415 [Methyloceanibacter marginalis]|uniref:Peptidase M41 domain-containing protein n=1 Tax=Methyloceanibacter marginalis TaxID=1774971 RepID=A0A1E3W8H9_9HYPH|nr:hypothetical protein AUC71_02415 [Methyloceanibacter marginalis]